MIARKLDSIIEQHFAHNRSALLLQGARQTGKTVAIRKYAQTHHCDLLEINFYEDTKARTIFEGANRVEDVLLRLSAYTSHSLQPGKTLIFFDEIQKYPDVVTWIKFLVEDGRYRYALSGSLLGVEMKDIRSIPVGFMAVQDVYPLDLEEFARAAGVSDAVMDTLQRAWESRTEIDAIVHDSMMRIVSLYLLVGGMPDVVQTYLDTKDLRQVQVKQKEILRLYHWDIAQYDAADKLYLDEIFDLIPTELNAKNKRFILKDLNEHRQFARHEDGFIWLRDAGTAIPVYNVEEPKAPLLLNKQRNLFKFFQNDVGLLACQYSENILLSILSGQLEINYGAIYENLVAQELLAHGWNLYYYNSKHLGEVDFLLEHNGVLPIEVKSGKDYNRHKALANILMSDEFDIHEGYVLCNGNLRQDGKVLYLPVYMTMFISNLRSSEPLICPIPL